LVTVRLEELLTIAREYTLIHPHHPLPIWKTSQEKEEIASVLGLNVLAFNRFRINHLGFFSKENLIS